MTSSLGGEETRVFQRTLGEKSNKHELNKLYSKQHTSVKNRAQLSSRVKNCDTVARYWLQSVINVHENVVVSLLQTTHF